MPGQHGRVVVGENRYECYAIENHPNDSRVGIDPHNIVQTLSSRMGTGGGNTPIVLLSSRIPDMDGGTRQTLQSQLDAVQMECMQQILF